MDELNKIYNDIKDRIDERLDVFKDIWENGSDEDVFLELVFCLLTPQSKARNAELTISMLQKDNLLYKGNEEEIAKVLNYVRFKNHKAEYIVRAREMFFKGELDIRNKYKELGSVKDLRKWLLNNIKGMGLKETSHYLRNIYIGRSLAILDRHILRNLKLYKVTEEIKNLNEKTYYSVEEKMNVFSKIIKIPMEYLDFILWYKETGDIYK